MRYDPSTPQSDAHQNTYRLEGFTASKFCRRDFWLRDVKTTRAAAGPRFSTERGKPTVKPKRKTFLPTTAISAHGDCSVYVYVVSCVSASSALTTGSCVVTSKRARLLDWDCHGIRSWDDRVRSAPSITIIFLYSVPSSTAVPIGEESPIVSGRIDKMASAGIL